jgi:hypothetical protein
MITFELAELRLVCYISEAVSYILRPSHPTPFHHSIFLRFTPKLRKEKQKHKIHLSMYLATCNQVQNFLTIMLDKSTPRFPLPCIPHGGGYYGGRTYDLRLARSQI